jgi:predicted metalloprotease
MQLGGQRSSGNIEDRRGMGVGIGGGLGVGGIVIALIAYFLGFDPGTATQVAEQIAPQRESAQQAAPKGAPADEMGQFVAKVLGSTEDVWTKIFESSGQRYRAPTLVLYDGQVRSACGMGQAAMGPFYCPQDEKLYIDLAFYRDLRTRFRAPGDFAQAYVIAHEVGHHVQTLLGTSDKVRSAQQSARSQEEVNQLQVRMELQADCYAGIWAHHADSSRQLIEAGDIEEALGAAQAVGDDTIQRRIQGNVHQETFTHGSGAQRQEWFRKGFGSGQVDSCNTFQ